MRTHNTKKGAYAVKQGAILFLCALICAGSIYGIGKVLGSAGRDQSQSHLSETVIPTAAPDPSATLPPETKGTQEKDETKSAMLDVEETNAPPHTNGPEQTQTAEQEPELPAIIPEESPKPSTISEATELTFATPAPVQDEQITVMADPLDERSVSHSANIGQGEETQLPLSGLLIGIDPGHQAHGNSDREPVAPGSSETKAKVSSGTQGVVSRVPEYETNLTVSLQLRDLLEAYGAEVHMTRETNDVDISNIERALIFNEANADLVLRIHCNGSTNSAAEGIGLYVTATGQIAEESYAIAEVILDAMAAKTGADKDGVFRRDTYSGLNWSEVPSMIVEMGFMSNPEEDLKLQDPEYQQKLVEGMVEGIAAYFGRTL